jgi:hypothetical protein
VKAFVESSSFSPEIRKQYRVSKIEFIRELQKKGELAHKANSPE